MSEEISERRLFLIVYPLLCNPAYYESLPFFFKITLNHYKTPCIVSFWQLPGSPTANEAQENVNAKCTSICKGAPGGLSCSKIVLVDIYREDQPNEVHRVYAIVDDQCMRENMSRTWVGARIWGMDHCQPCLIKKGYVHL